MILYYSHDITENDAQLLEDEFKHCCKVLRHKTGDEIHVTNGKGILAKAKIAQIAKNSAELDILSLEHQAKKTHHITLALAPPKNRSRWEWLLEKSVEIGVDRVIPLNTHHSERSKLNLERSNKIIRSTALQSHRLHHPSITEITALPDLLKDTRFNDYNRFIAHYKPSFDSLQSVELKQSSSIILIGPEGDFSEQEIESCMAVGYKPVTISHNRLRTETAGIVSVNILAGKILP